MHSVLAWAAQPVDGAFRAEAQEVQVAAQTLVVKAER